jgi:hypothetical protein
MLMERSETKNKAWELFSKAERQTQKTSFRDKKGKERRWDNRTEKSENEK